MTQGNRYDHTHPGYWVGQLQLHGSTLVLRFWVQADHGGCAITVALLISCLFFLVSLPPSSGLLPFPNALCALEFLSQDPLPGNHAKFFSLLILFPWILRLSFSMFSTNSFRTGRSDLLVYLVI